ncbi:capsid protein [Crucivirus-182]|nr:capsid protein [Crucivirus-182]
MYKRYSKKQIAPAIYVRKRAPAKKKTYKKKSSWSAPQTFGNVGSEIGKYVPMPYGSQIGRAVGTAGGYLYRKITGRGDYLLQNGGNPNITKPIPRFSSDNSIRIKHKEFISNISSTTTFNNITYKINPGNQRLFPWMSMLSQCYEKYRINSMVIYYRSLSGDSMSSSNVNLGKILLGCDYNASDQPWINADQFYGSMHSNSGKPSADLMLAIECKNSPELFIRTGGLKSGEDRKSYDFGTLQIGTDSSQSANEIGECFVSYDISLMSSVNNGGVGLNVKTAKAQLSNCTTTRWFGDLTTWEHNDIDGLTISTDGNYLVFPAEMSSGTFQLIYTMKGSTPATLALPTFDATSGVIGKTIFDDDTDQYLSNAGDSSTRFILTTIFTITDKNAAFGMLTTTGTLPGGSFQTADLQVIKLNHADSLKASEY